ncbi:MAG: hypothetical protein AB7S38_08385 [Vulcanimicrobiota bacterium]
MPDSTLVLDVGAAAELALAEELAGRGAGLVALLEPEPLGVDAPPSRGA